VLAYKAKTLDYLIARMFVRLRYIGLANILFNALKGQRAGRGDSVIHIELLQQEMNVDNLLKAYRETNKNESYNNALALRSYLGYGSASNVAKLLIV